MKHTEHFRKKREKDDEVTFFNMNEDIRMKDITKKTRKSAIIILPLLLLLLIMGERTSPAGEKPLVKADSYFSIWPETIEGSEGEYITAHLISNRFIFAYLPAGEFIFREAIDIEESTTRESGNGFVTVAAYRAKPGNKTPLWTFSAKGRGGEFLFDEYNYKFYMLKQAYCCDMSARQVYYDLQNGEEIFSTTTPALTIVDENNMYRHIGYDDGVGSERPPEMAHDNTISGVLYYTGDGMTTRKLAVIADPEYEYRQQEFDMTIKQKRLSGENNVIRSSYKQQFSFTAGMLLSVTLFCRCETDEKFEIPIVDDHFVIDKAVVSKGITLKELP